jgi:hypothetical protein
MGNIATSSAASAAPGPYVRGDAPLADLITTTLARSLRSR